MMYLRLLFIRTNYMLAALFTNSFAHVMQWNGKKWTDAGVQLNGAVSCFTVHNKKLYTGGYFGQLNNKPAPFVVSYDGKKWNYTSKGLGGTLPYHWMSTLVGYGNDLYAGGNFTTGEDTKMAKNLSVFKSNSWSPVVYNMEGSVYTMAVYKNNLYVAGSFLLPMALPYRITLRKLSSAISADSTVTVST